MKRAAWCLLGCLFTSTAMARFDWSEYREYQPQAAVLRFAAARPEPLGQLLIWPEQQQLHQWLAMAPWWQDRGWELVLLLPDPQQSYFDPAAEKVSDAQQTWVTTLGERLAPIFERQPELPQVVLTQGSASLWYQQLIQTGTLPAPSGLMVLNATPSDKATQQMLAMSLSRSDWPVLDLFSTRQPVSLLNQKLRRHASAREQADYESITIHSPLFSSRIMAAWITRHGWMPLPPGAPDFLKGVTPNETGLSRSQDTGSGREAAPAKP